MGQTNNTQYLSICSLKQKPTDQPTISSVELYHNCRAKLFPFDIVIPSVTYWSAAFGFNNTVSFILSSNPLRCGSVQPLWYRAQDHPSSADSLLPLCLQQWPGWTYNFGRPTRTWDRTTWSRPEYLVESDSIVPPIIFWRLRSKFVWFRINCGHARL